MERNVQDLVVKEGNVLELPERALKTLDVKVGDVVKVLYSDGAVILMNDGKFGEQLLEKISKN